MVARVLALFWSSSLITTIYAAGMDCVPGTFVSNTGCQRCPNGTFSDKHNATKCSQCDRCSGKHNEVVKSCTSSSNTNCSCQSGYYYGRFLFCLKCKQCKKGRGVVTNCTATSNTECGLCVKGQTFSSEKNMERCKPCRRCPKGHIVQEECTRRTDTVCVPEKDKNNSKLTRIPIKVSSEMAATRPPTRNRTTTTKKKRWKTSTKRVSTEPTHNQTVTSIPVSDDTDSDDDTGLQAALYALIAVVVVLVVVFVLVCWYKRRDRPRKQAKPGIEEPSRRSSTTDVAEAVANPYSSLPFISARPSQERMLRDAPYTLISDLSQYLNPGDRWKQLGGKLNFNSTQINNFAVDKANASQAMLQEWGQKDGATVVALQSTFRKMKWTKEERMVGKYV